MDCTYEANRFRMPLLNVVGLTPFNTSFFACFAFLREEKEEDYDWALTRIAKIFENSRKPAVIVTDRELTLMRALDRTFSDTQGLRCVWHIDKNIVAKMQTSFHREEWKEFLQLWAQTVKAKSEEAFYEHWQELSTKLASKPQVINYLSDTWLPYNETVR